MPGTQNNYIYDALNLYGQGMDHYLVRHEYSTTFMADGYARACGETAVAITVPGPGATNASTGILNAMNDCSPVLLVVGQSDRKFDRRHPSKIFHGMDGTQVFRSITRLAARANSASEIPDLIESAFRIFRSGRPGPAMLEFPADTLTQEAEVTIAQRVEYERIAPDSSAVGEAAERLSRSKLPVIFAGGGVNASGANAELQALAEKLGAPVIVTRRGKGALPEDHELSLSNINGIRAAQAWKQADCVLSLGVRYTSIDTRGWTLQLPRTHVQMDCDAEEIGREYETDVGVVGDIKLSLQALIERLPSESVKRIAENWIPPLEEIRVAAQKRPEPLLLPEIRDQLPRDGILCVDVNSVGYRTFAEFPVYDPATFYYPAIAVSLGSAFAAAIGARVARPEAPVVALVGDGGFMMGCMELAMAMQYGIRFVTVVTNEDCLTAIKGSQMASCEGRYIDVDLKNPDFVAFAESFGARGIRVDDLNCFRTTLADALRSEVPTIIEIPLHDRREELIRDIPWLDPDWLKAL
jgi:acetolactate synthase-1/2/3 large subunit